MELLFRGKDTQDEWVYGNNIVYDPKKSLINGIEVKPSTIGQYIRRKDQNGKELFTGDVISYDDGEPILLEAVMPSVEFPELVGATYQGNIIEDPNIYAK